MCIRDSFSFDDLIAKGEGFSGFSAFSLKEKRCLDFLPVLGPPFFFDMATVPSLAPLLVRLGGERAAAIFFGGEGGGAAILSETFGIF